MGFIFWFRYPNDGRFIFVLGKMAIDAVIAGIDFAANEPFPTGRIARIEGCVPALIPGEQIGIFFITGMFPLY